MRKKIFNIIRRREFSGPTAIRACSRGAAPQAKIEDNAALVRRVPARPPTVNPPQRL